MQMGRNQAERGTVILGLVLVVIGMLALLGRALSIDILGLGYWPNEGFGGSGFMPSGLTAQFSALATFKQWNVPGKFQTKSGVHDRLCAQQGAVCYKNIQPRVLRHAAEHRRCVLHRVRGN